MKEIEANASTSAPDRPDMGMLRGPAAGDARNVAAVGFATATATSSSICRLRSAAISSTKDLSDGKNS